ncbi:riboflavin-specific deaminase-like protein [Litorimonas taeanensis]|uniref:Riboflavin-specific deaminase-like protein n=1 Tax=Litorimonas taeanensis TaxID=568099 RepID=A0A420WKA0_9PROT|nr:RibD family protein [Litorimonas taeanensis]RKQ71430.1 riboflavin-specific deaminase-like protein [Litorimonas taeanensis]
MKRPLVTLKLATSLDGKIALANGQSEWITGEAARRQGRLLRAEHDAIAVGSNTAVLDNPQLTTRLEGRKNPHRVIFDSQVRLSPESNLAQTARTNPVTVFCSEGAETTVSAMALKSLHVQVLPVAKSEAGLDVKLALSLLKNLGLQTVLLEGGGTLAASFIRHNLVDTIEWFRAPVVLGAEGRPAIGNLALEHISNIYRFDRIDVQEIGVDIWERYQVKPNI